MVNITSKGCFLLGAIVCCGIIENAAYSVLKPLGPKLCETICRQIGGCSSYIYVTHYLSCLLSTMKLDRHGPHKQYHVFKITRNPYSVKMCPTGSKLFYERRNFPQCSESRSNKRAPLQMTRVLLLQFTNRGPPQEGIQFHVSNYSLATYPYIRMKRPTAVVCLLALRKLVVAAKRPFRLFTAPVDKGEITVIRKGLDIPAMAVDETKQLVFLVSRTTKIGIRSWAADTGDFRHVVTMRFKCFAEGLAVAPKRSRIFVACFNDRIAQFTYQGEMLLKPVARGPVSFSLYVERDALYYVKETNVFKTSLTDWSTAKIRLGSEAKDLIVMDDIIYSIPFPFHNEMITVSGKGTTGTVKIPLQHRVVRIHLCPLP